MKPNYLFTSMLVVTALIVTSCSTPKMAQNNAMQDDVYNTTAQAKEYKPSEPVQSTQTTDSNADYYGKTDPNYDMDYSSRIDRFYYGNAYRGYYDPYYNYYGYNSYYSPYGYGLGAYYGSYFNNPFNYRGWGYYGGLNYNPYWSYYGGLNYNPYWGLYSNYNYYGTGYYGGGVYAGRNTYNPNYGPRPTRSNGSGSLRPTSNYNGSIPGRGNVSNSDINRPSRPSTYNPATNGSNSGTSSRTSNGSTESSRPTRSEAPSRPAPTYNPPPQQSSPPPSSSGGGSSGGSSGGGSSRPTRGGGRG